MKYIKTVEEFENYINELIINPEFKYPGIASRWLEDNKNNLRYKVACALLCGDKNPDETFNIPSSNYDRILRALDSIVTSEHDGAWRTNNYNTFEAEKWAIESLSKMFFVKDYMGKSKKYNI
jgi:hypothetical protein